MEKMGTVYVFAREQIGLLKPTVLRTAWRLTPLTHNTSFLGELHGKLLVILDCIVVSFS
jgi:hypothetical protein